MENILSEFSVKNLSIKLTDEKLFINTPSATETFALRSLNGIGVIDLVEKYDKDMINYKIKSQDKKIKKITGIIFLIIGAILAYLMSALPILALIEFVVLVGVGLITIISSNQELEEPKMISAVRIMLNSGNRDFEFNKSSKVSEDVAQFVAKVESTLSAFHKNNS
jgi:hypothetical protein